MTTHEKRQQKKKAGALVLVSSRAGTDVSHRQGAFAQPGFAGTPADFQLNPARSAFLAQLTRQYETKTQAVKRRAETRVQACQRYQQPTPKASLRHLVWA